MRYKIFFAFLLIVTLGISAAWLKRATLVEQFAFHQAPKYGISLDSLELGFVPNHDLVIKSVCFTHQFAVGCARDIEIEWQWPSFKTVTITDISVSQADIIALMELPSPSASKSTQNSVFDSLNPLLETLLAVNLPFDIAVHQAKIAIPDMGKPVIASILWNETNKQITMTNAEPTPSLSIAVERRNQLIRGTMKVDIQAAQDFVNPFFPIKNNLPDLVSFDSEITLDWVWQLDGISVTANLNPTAITYHLPTVGLTSLVISEPSTVSFALTQDFLKVTALTPIQLKLELLEQNWDAWLASMPLPDKFKAVAKQHIAPTLIISDISEVNLDLTTETLKLDALTLAWSSFSFNGNNLLWSKEKQSLSAWLQGTLNVDSLEPRLTSPIKLDTKFDITKNKAKTSIELEQLNLSASAWNDGNLMAKGLSVSANGLIDIQQVGELSTSLQYEMAAETVSKAGAFELKQPFLAGNLDAKNESYHSAGLISYNHKSSPQQLGAFKLDGNTNSATLNYNLVKASLPPLKNTLQMTELKPLKLQHGSFNLSATTEFNLAQKRLTKANVKLKISDLTGSYDDTPWRNLNYYDDISFDAGVWHSVLEPQPNLTIDGLTKSDTFRNVNTHFAFRYQHEQPSFVLTGLSLKAFGGKVQTDTITWPITTPQTVALTVHKLDLSQLLALQKSDGIVVDGYISGSLPLTLSKTALAKTQVSIKDGLLSNDGPALIQVKDSPAVKSLKTQQSNLKLAFEALKHLQVNTLSAKVNMQPNGAMELDTQIRGYNPDIDNDVHFNLNLNYDLPGLIQSLLIADQLENNLTKSIRPKEPK